MTDGVEAAQQSLSLQFLCKQAIKARVVSISKTDTTYKIFCQNTDGEQPDMEIMNQASSLGHCKSFFTGQNKSSASASHQIWNSPQNLCHFPFFSIVKLLTTFVNFIVALPAGRSGRLTELLSPFPDLDSKPKKPRRSTSLWNQKRVPVGKSLLGRQRGVPALWSELLGKNLRKGSCSKLNFVALLHETDL